MEVLCNLTAEQAALYQAVVDDMMAKIETSDGHRTRGPGAGHHDPAQAGLQPPGPSAARRLPLAGRSGKLERLEEILDEVLAAGEKALLFTQYAEFGGMLRWHLRPGIGREVPSCTAGSARPNGTPWWPGSSPRTARRRCSYCPSRPAAPGSP